MLVENNEPHVNFDSIQAFSGSKRRLRLLFALALLLTALALVVLKNQQFWSDLLGFDEVSDQTTSAMNNKIEQHVLPTPPRKTGARQSGFSNADALPEVLPEPQEISLSPLQVDVTYSSGQHETLMTRNSAVHIDLQQDSGSSSAAPANSASLTTGDETNPSGAGVRVRFSGQTVEFLGRPVEPIYPLLAQQANVQGSVVLQGRISEDGSVQALKVLSGPALLTTAALEAIKQWHFKPRYENGRAVPAETRITVNFTISTR
jgi:TonB family protein